MKLMRRPLLVAYALVSTLLTTTSFANMPSDPQMPISHCYHWLDQRTQSFLTFKYKHAAANGGEFSFYTTGGNGAAAGPGIYCAKTLLGSYSYGDRVVRLELVDDIVLTDGSTQVCGTTGKFYANQSDCDRQPVDIHLYSKSSEWYVIKNPKAIKAWSANSPALVADLNAIKAHGTSSSNSHFDMTLQLMSTEAATIPQKTYTNSQARMDLLEILKDPKKVQQIPILGLVEMIAAARTDKISDAEKKKLYQTHLMRALKDPALGYNDYVDLLKKFSDVREHLKGMITAIGLVATVNPVDFKAYNPVVLVAAIDKLDISVSTGAIRSLWQTLWASKTSFESLLSLDLKADGAVLKQFDAFIPPGLDVDQVQHNNIGFLLSFLDKYVPAKGPSYQRLTEKLFAKLVRGTHYYVADSTYEKLQNAALGKEQALLAVLREIITTPAPGLDMFAMAALYGRVKAQLSADQVQKLETMISAMPIKTSPRLTYLILEDYKSGKHKLPDFLTRELVLNRLIERSISERSLGANTTNTYRLILSGLYAVYVDEAKAAKSKPAKDAALQQGATYFDSLATLLEKNKLYAYAYAARQNAVFMAEGMKYEAHPMETLVADYDMGKKPTDAIIENLVVHGMDSGLMLYLVDLLGKGGADAGKADALLSKLLAYYVSPAFQTDIQDKNFLLMDAEKKLWANFLNNEELAPGGKVRTDLCSFNGRLHDSRGVLAKKYSAQWKQIESVKNQIYANCRKSP